MADEKNTNSKQNPDSKKTGNSCGFTVGCLIIIIAIAAVIFFIFIRPALDDGDYSYEALKEKILNLKDKASETIEKTDEIYQDGKESYEDLSDKTEKHIDDMKEVDDNSREELDKAAPTLIAD